MQNKKQASHQGKAIENNPFRGDGIKGEADQQGGTGVRTGEACRREAPDTVRRIQKKSTRQKRSTRANEHPKGKKRAETTKSFQFTRDSETRIRQTKAMRVERREKDDSKEKRDLSNDGEGWRSR